MADLPLSYVLCSNPRSGTTLLCDLLAQTGVAGNPDSFFRQKSLQDWCDDWQVSGSIDTQDPDFTRRYLDAMLAEGRGSTPVFGIRIMGADLCFASAWLDSAFPGHTSDAARFEAAFGRARFIHLSRSDKLAEAVSYLRAEQTGLWHQRPDGTALEQIAPTEPPGYDPDAITQRMTELARYDQAWNAWFELEKLQPLRIGYEALAQDPQGILAQVLRFIGQDPDRARAVTPRVRKLADETNADWIARYRASHPKP